jgi:GAF domain-containing protein
LLSYGLSGSGIIFLFGAAVLANIFFNQTIGGIFAFISFLAVIGVGTAMVTGKLPVPPVQVMANSGDAGQWAVAGMVYMLLMSLVMGSLYKVIQGTNAALRSQEDLTQKLEDEQASLERRVEERSTALKQRVAQFEIASQIAREISGETNLERLFANSVNLIRERFSFYHVGVFVNDDRKEYAVLRAATGEAGRVMLERGHRLKIGEVGIVGYVINHGEARIVFDLASDVVHYKNPLLPETRSEMALPLRSGVATIGALDVQSVLENAFSQDDVSILQIIADQLAIAIEKTRLVNDLQHSVNELEAVHQSTTQKAWKTHLKNTRQKVAYRYRESQLENQVVETEHSLEAENKGQSVLTNLPAGDGSGKMVTVLAVPIKLRNQVLGVVDIQFEGANVSPDLISLIEGTVNRLAVSLENARLLEEIRGRAERERMVSEISSKVRSASDVDSVLRIAAQEIGKSLGVSEVMVQLRKDG